VKLRAERRLNSRLERNLLAYSAAAGAACMGSLYGPPAAEGKIIYRHVNVQLQRQHPFPLDLNSGGRVDFFLLNRSYSSGSGDRTQYVAVCRRPVSLTSFGWDCNVSARSSSLNAVRTNGTRLAFASALRGGERIQKGDRFRTDYFAVKMGEVLFPRTSGGTRTTWFGPWMNGGKGVKNRYLGLKFKIKGRFHFGWARLTVTTTQHNFTATLTGYAYETIPGKSIIAGKTRGSDVEAQPATLGRLALGRK